MVIYSIDPRGLVYTGLTAADNTRGRTPQQISQVSQQRSQEMFDSQDGMVILAHETGGLFMQNTNDIDGALRHVMDDGEGYYLIGYHPDASTFDAKTGKPKFHNMQVRVKRAGLHVRARSGFFGTSDRESAPVPRTRQAQIARAMASPLGGGALHLRLTTLFSPGRQKRSFLDTMLHIDAKDLRFTDEPDDWHKAVIDIVAMTFGENGQQVDATDRTWTIRLKGDAYRDVLKQGMVYSVHVPVKKPGAYQVRVVLRDAGSELLGSASQFIEVPDIDKGRLALSGIVLRSEAGQRRAADQSPKMKPKDHSGGEADPQGTPAVRIFKQGTAITYGYQVLNAQADANKKPDLEVQTRLFRDGRAGLRREALRPAGQRTGRPQAPDRRRPDATRRQDRPRRLRAPGDRHRQTGQGKVSRGHAVHGFRDSGGPAAPVSKYSPHNPFRRNLLQRRIDLRVGS